MSIVQLSEADLTELLIQVWSSYVDEHPLLPGDGTAAADWTASVAVTGAWRGSVVIELSEAAARDVAALMLDVTTAETDEMVDAIGELANIVGGNVKSVMPEPSALALPTVTRGPADQGGDLVCSLPITWHNHPLRVQMFRTEEDPTR